MWLRARVGSVAVVLVGVLLPAPAALAALPSCATPPAAYTGTDATVAAITQANIDADQNCSAVTARVDALDADVTAAATQAHGDSAAVKSVLSGWSSTNPLQVALPAGGSGQAVQVTNWPAAQAVSFDSSASGQLDGQAHAAHIDLWMLIGAVVACFLFDVFLRKVWP